MFKKKPVPQAVAIASCAFALTPGIEIQLLPAGEFRAIDGRPKEVSCWKVDAGIAALIIADSAALSNPQVIDYEHQTILSADNGQPAPAAGWFKDLVWREGLGLFATVEWTAAAAEWINTGAYKFISPVIVYDKKTGAVKKILHAALTNHAAIDGMEEVSARAAAKFLAPESTEKESLTMDIEELLNQLRWMLNLPITAGVEEVTAELQKAITLIKGGQTDTAAASFSLTAFLAGKDSEIVALKSATPDLSKFVPVETMTELRNQVATLTASLNGKEVDDLVVVALTSGKLLPAQESWARDLGKSNLAALTAYLDTAQAIVALSGTQTDGKEPDIGGGSGDLSDTELAVCKNMGVDPEEFKKTKAAQVAV